MLMLATVGLKPCETTTELYTHRDGCHLCTNTADGYDAAFDGPLCTTYAEAFSDFYDDLVEGGR